MSRRLPIAVEADGIRLSEFDCSSKTCQKALDSLIFENSDNSVYQNLKEYFDQYEYDQYYHQHHEGRIGEQSSVLPSWC